MASTVSSTVSRLLSFTSPATVAAAGTTATSAVLLLPKTFRPVLRSNLSVKLKPLRLSSSSSFTTISASSISVGSKLRDATFSYFDSAGELQTTTVADLTASKKTILFAVPGAFTPTCSQKHVPGFVNNSQALKSKGVDVIACISVNDAFVMKAWKEQLKIDDEVLLLSDGNGDFTRAIGAELDLSDKPVGLGVRSRRYSMLVEDGVVKVLNMESGGAFTSSSAEDLLKVL
ncbi:hypothetical protein Dimus_034704 [Dionaea muscipula]